MKRTFEVSGINNLHFQKTFFKSLPNQLPIGGQTFQINFISWQQTFNSILRFFLGERNL